MASTVATEVTESVTSATTKEVATEASTSEGVTKHGKAFVRQFFTGESGRGAPHWHLTIETLDDVALHTELVAQGKAGTLVRSAVPTRPADILYEIAVPDLAAAQAHQRSVMGPSSALWGKTTPNCATHCGDILTAGKVAGAPTSGAASILGWIQSIATATR